ncbi:MAG: N-acetylmuramoyl-L-alanine amidase, partial [Clostridia bacterium]|nr:N-acetylmuramoyl-L-alanine amidase [Clostridia bacterium]
MGADLYIPIHSNAGGNQTGTYVFYNGSIQGCKEFSREIFDRVAALTGTPYSTSRHKEDYLCLLPDGAPFREIKNPTMPMAYIEVEFHDKAEKAQWIVNNNEALAKAIADGVVAYAEKYLLGA